MEARPPPMGAGGVPFAPDPMMAIAPPPPSSHVMLAPVASGTTTASVKRRPAADSSKYSMGPYPSCVLQMLRLVRSRVPSAGLCFLWAPFWLGGDEDTSVQTVCG